MGNNQKFQTTIKKSLQFLCDNPVFIQNLFDSQFAYFWCVDKDHKLAQITPFFKRNSSHEIEIDDLPSDLVSTPPSLFHYAMKSNFRGVLLGLRFIESGDLLHKKNFFSASIISYYTAAFHFLFSYLSANGKVIINPTDIQRKQLDLGGSLIIAKFTKKGSWKCERISRSHSSLWGELNVIFKERAGDLPDFIEDFFKYLLSIDASVPDTKHELIEKGIQRLPLMRHESLYEGYGFDDYVVDSMFSEEGEGRLPLKDLGNKGLFYKRFAEEFLHLCLLEINDLRNNSLNANWNHVKELFSTSIIIPPMETGNPDLTHNRKLEGLVEEFLIWLK